MKNQTNYWLALNRISGLGSATLFPLLADYTPAQLFKLSHTELQQLGMKPALIKQFRTPDWQAVDNDLAWIESPQHHLITINDAHYPTLLRETASAPIVLFCQGNASLLEQPQLAMVGSRNPSAAGKDNAFAFAKSLAQAGLVITSGLALGIDAASHRGALAAEGYTVAVVGCGLQQVYPSRHRALVDEIIAKQGLIVSEFPPDTGVRAEHFPRRNRIISGLSLGCLVTEAALRSGSLITARYAMEQGREVFALPGSIHNPLARGCHSLLKQGAKLVETANDIIEELGPLRHVVQSAETPVVVSEQPIGDDCQQLLPCVDFSPTPFELIAQRCNLPAHLVASNLVVLELQGFVRQHHGNYERIK